MSRTCNGYNSNLANKQIDFLMTNHRLILINMYYYAYHLLMLIPLCVIVMR